MWPMLGPIKSYGPVYLAGIVLHLVLALVWARRLRLRGYLALVVSTCYLFGMIVGAKILFDIRAGGFSPGRLLTAEHWLQGGMWGGPLAYLAVAVPLMLMFSGNRRAAVDLVALAAPLPMLIAKVACLCNGCCYGKPSSLPWGISFPRGGSATPAGVPLHPTQIYEMLVLAVAAVVLARVNRPFWRGTLLLWFLAVYGLGRAAVECLRGDFKPDGFAGPLSHSQWLCLAASGVSAVVLAVCHRLLKEESVSP